jgi:hypothetical protein
MDDETLKRRVEIQWAIDPGVFQGIPTEMKTKSITGEKIRSLQDKICNYSDPKITPVNIILLDHAVEMLEWAGNYCDVGDIRYSDCEVGAEVIAHYQAAQVLSKLVAGIK